jgi:hypothetical protein
MKLSKIIIASICSFWLLSASAVFAEDKGTDNPGASEAETELIAHGWRVSKLKGATVYNEDKEKIGKIDDFIVAKDGSLTFAIVNIGGFLGYGDYKVAVPVHRFSQVVPKPVLPNASKEKLRKLPRFDYRLILGK